MKKIGLFMLVILGGLAACKKSATTEQGVSAVAIDTVLDMNMSYNYTFSTMDQNLRIISQALHASVSVLATNTASSVLAFQYVPDSSYVGMDSVVIGMPGHPHGPGNGGTGGCNGKKHGGPPPPPSTYTFRFKVGNTN